MTDSDRQHLNLLAIFHYVWAGLVALFSCLTLIYAGIGVAMALGAFDGEPDSPPHFVGWIIVGFSLLFLILGWAWAALTVWAGRSMQQHRRWVLCMIVACLECLSVPLGTILGVFTIVVLVRPSVKAAFEAGR